MDPATVEWLKKEKEKLKPEARPQLQIPEYAPPEVQPDIPKTLK